MEDVEKNRVEYVQRLETQFSHMQAECAKFKAVAEKWEPRVTVTTDTESTKVTFGLQFGGKFVHATVTQEWLTEMDETSAVTQLVDALTESLVVSELRQVFLPEVKRMRQATKAINGAGKW